MEKLIEEAVIFCITKIGYASKRSHQRDVLFQALSGKDSLFVAPTGSGKSLIFEALPSLLVGCGVHIFLESF